MNITVCIKQVPEEAGFDRETNTVIREKRNQVANPSDIHALELALEVRDRLGGEITAISMGKPFAASILTGAATLGADRLFLVSDTAFAGSDTYATASVLARALRHIGGADLVLCGRRAIDGETGQVGPELAVLLGIPCLTNVCGLEEATADHIVCKRLLEDRFDIFRLPFPCLLTCCDGIEGIAHPRLASLAGLRRARTTPVATLTLAELQGVEAYGLRGSPTRVRETFFPPESGRQGIVWPDFDSGVAAMAEHIRSASGETPS